MSSYEQDQYDDVYVEDDAAAHAEMLAENEMAEAAYHDWRQRNADDEICICAACGLISPLCACQLSAEARVNRKFPWPTDPAALTEQQASTLTAVRFDFRARVREARA